MPPRGGRKCNRQAGAELCVDAIRQARGVRNPSLARGRSRERLKHNGAAFMAYRDSLQGSVRGTSMRLIVGIIIGCALTVGGAYVADTMATAGAKPVMVNWDVVAKNLDSVTTLARAGWKKIAGRAD
jgi:hypothetical protein